MGKQKSVKRSPKPTVIDFFCGAGGFSEGFRQQGFKVIKGVDNWAIAIETHNLNHGLSDKPFDIGLYWGEDSGDTKYIDELSDTDVLVGSPPCVSFSMANKSGKADKSLGIHLIKTYLRVVTVKRHARNSVLKAWLLENVPNSKGFIQNQYTFDELNLKLWAERHNLKPTDLALKINGEVLCAFDYGAPQTRKRYVCGENFITKKFPLPTPTSFSKNPPKTLGYMKECMPSPYDDSNKKWIDPNYPSLIVGSDNLTDHFYDTGLFVYEWEKARDLKKYHPFMGMMSFPENFQKPSRTIVATRSGSTRESIIFKSEYTRQGHGKYRLPTIREAATLMGYPYTYQFLGSETTRWKQIGNSVSPQLSFALAGEIRKGLGLNVYEINEVVFDTSLPAKNKQDLRSLGLKTFSKPAKRKKGSKFRRVIVKEKNTTLELLNYHPIKGGKYEGKWYLCLFKGTGMGYKQVIINDWANEFVLLRHSLHSEVDVAQVASLISLLKKHESTLQNFYENDIALVQRQNPVLIVEGLREELIRLKAEDNLQPIAREFKDVFVGWRQGIVAAHFVAA